MPRKAAPGLTLVRFLINGNQGSRVRNHGFLTQEYSVLIFAPLLFIL